MIVLSGANSLVGAALLPVLRNCDQVCAFDTDQGDITDPAFVARILDEVKPSYLVNCVESPDVEECEYKRELAYHLNGQLPGELARLCRERNITLVHFSSVMVFNGEKDGAYSESDAADPRTVYGDSKAYGEKMISQSGCDSLIFRVPLVIGKYDQYLFPLFRKLASSERLDVIRGQIVSLVYVQDLVQVVAEAITRGFRGMYNVANQGSVRQLELTLDVMSIYDKKTGRGIPSVVNEIDFSDYLSPAEWPMNMALDITKLTAEGIRMRSWRDALEECLDSTHTFLSAAQ